MYRGNEILFAASGSDDLDGHYAHIWYKPLKIFFHGTRGPVSMNLVCSIGDSGQS